MPLSRRALLGASLAALPYAQGLRAQNATDGRVSEAFSGLIVREEEPLNLESPPSALQSLMTPNELFYIRNHFPEPVIDATSWRLTIEGAVERPREMPLADLMALPPRTQHALLECAGNGRVFLVPKEPGAQWQVGAVGQAEWVGVPLTTLLERVGVTSSAVDVIFEGADHGEIKDEPKSPGDIPFARAIPLAKAQSGDVLLAYKMNGADLSPSHGFPLRVIVRGWYGMASVKWLRRIVVTAHPFDGFFQSLHYSHWERPHGVPSLTPITEMPVKSIIVQPSVNGIIRAGTPYTVRGKAWSGAGTISGVDVSLDNGASWAPARLTTAATPFSWRTWEYDWSRPAVGRHQLMARATDSQGQVQPMARDKDRRTYEITHVIPTPVMAR